MKWWRQLWKRPTCKHGNRVLEITPEGRRVVCASCYMDGVDFTSWLGVGRGRIVRQWVSYRCGKP